MELPSLRDETTWYAIILGSVVGAAVIRTATPPIIRQPVTLFIGTIIKYISPLLVIKLATIIRLYTVFASPDGAIAWLRRHDIVRLWPLKHILMLALYWGANFSCLFIFFAGLQDAGKRAGRLSLINLLVLYAGPHLSVLADIVGLAIPTYRRLHSSVAATSFFMAVFHVVVASIKHVDPLLSTSKSAFGLISHPFAVVSWEAGPVDRLELMITPENGWTRHLFEQAQLQGLINCWVFFTGPHGVVANVENYDRILVLASQFGIIPCMPYLQQIKSLLPGNPSSAHLSMESKQSGPSRLKSVHLCWEAQRKFPTRGKRHSPATDNTTPDDAAASGNEKTLQTFDKFLQSFLDDIHFSNRKVGLYFAISENGYQPQSRGIEWSKRAVTEYRRIPLQDVLDDELKKKKAGHKLLVIASLSSDSRRELASIMNKRLDDSLDFFEIPG
ncbi:hypothetical protein Purlil1_12761 [Purpureocillium lilacinum]|uniref:Uncharacterized protein n=1 Tax=Purpureocillium lilacinum TaxID=33203 RepID=A0ABR0BGE7_PURLI|nr:hypothetical protein Purlil1_12761 [Purpureocillium lilacinum]